MSNSYKVYASQEYVNDSIEQLDPKLLPDLPEDKPAFAILPQVTCTPNDDTGDGLPEGYAIPGRWEDDFELNRIYKVVHNETTYECKPYPIEEDGTTFYLLGNIETYGLPGGNTEAPFVISAFPNSYIDKENLSECGMVNYVTGEAPSSLVLSITAEAIRQNPQFLTTDSNNAARWEERTHWDDSSIAVPKGDYPGDLDGTYITTLPIHPIEEGRVYTVEIEGIVFETTFTKTYSEDYGLAYVSEEYEDEENRWCQIYLFPNNGISGWFGRILNIGFGGTGTPTYESANDGSYTQNIYIHAGDIKTLDPKYLGAAPSKSKITILPKVILTVSDPNDPGDGAPITTPFAEYPSAGDTWNITYNGIEYACELVDGSTIPGMELPFSEGAIYFGGNLTAAGFEHIASNNDAPFVILAASSEEFATEMGAYGTIMPIVTLDQTFTVSITKSSKIAPSQLTLRSNGEMVWEERTHWIESGGVVELIPVKEYTQEELETQMTQPLSSALMAGKIYEVTLGETTYSCPAVSVTEDGITALVLGNTDVLGVPGGNPDAPFTFIEMPPGVIGSDMPYYWRLQPIDESILSGETVNFGITFSGEIIHKIDNKYLPSYDWNAEKDEPGYIANRTHWTTTKPTEILKDFTFSEEIGTITSPLKNIPGIGTYKVIWNGLEYDCVAEELKNDNGFTYYVLGKTSMLGGSITTGDFAVALSASPLPDIDPNIYGYVMPIANTASPNVISITQPAGVVYKLDDKYINWKINSVNGKTGDVVLTPEDIGAINEETFNLKNGQFQYSITNKSSLAQADYSLALGDRSIALGKHSIVTGGSSLAATDLRVQISNISTDNTYESLRNFTASMSLAEYIGCELFYGTDIYSAHATIVNAFTDDDGIHYIRLNNTLYFEALSDATVYIRRSLASGSHSIAIGTALAASSFSFAKGHDTYALSNYSTAQGLGVRVNRPYSTAIGRYNLDKDPIDFHVVEKKNVQIGWNAQTNLRVASEIPEIDRISASFVADTVSKPVSEITVGDIILTNVGIGKQNNVYYEVLTVLTTTASNYYDFILNATEIVSYRDELGSYALAIGNGESYSTRSNASIVDWSGNGYFAGDLYVNGDGQTIGFDGAKKVATEEFVTEAVNAALAALGLPTPTAADAGKVLRVNAEGKYELVSP